MDYICVTSVHELETYIGTAKIIAFDFETAPTAEHRNTPEAAINAHTADIVGVSFSVKEGTGVYVPLSHRATHGTVINANFDAIMGYLARLMADTSIVKVAHNLVFEAMFLCKHGIIPKQPLYDTMIAHLMTLKTTHTFNDLRDSGLKTLANEYFNAGLVDFKELTGIKHFDELDPTDDKTVRYACADSDYALRLYYLINGWFDKNLPKHRNIVEEIESPVAVYVGLMWFNGLLVDKKLMIEKQKEADITIAGLKNALIDIIGNDINIGSNASTSSLKGYIFKTLGLPMLKKTKKGNATLDDETLILLAEWSNQNRPELAELFTLIKEYRKWTKLKSTFIDGYIEKLDPATGRIHPNLMQLGAKSGRFSCNKPNLQNIPNGNSINIRDFIIAPQEYSILELDYSQIEARLAAYLSQDKMLLDIYNNNLDLHAMTTASIYKIPLEEASDKSHPLYKKRRTVAKATFFGFLYGISDTGLSRNLKTSAGIDSPTDECKQFLANLAKTYRTLSAWQKRTIRRAKKLVYTETELGRRCYCPHINISNYGLRGNAERSALNHPVQGLAADLLKLSMVRLMRIIAENSYIKPILTVHDSLVFYVPDEKIDMTIPLIKEVMEESFKEIPKHPLLTIFFNMPIVADVSVGKSYGSMNEYHHEGR